MKYLINMHKYVLLSAQIFSFLSGFTLLVGGYDLLLTGTAILSSDNTTLAGMRKSCGQSCHLNRDEKEVGGLWSGPGGKVNPTVSYGPEQLSTTAEGGLGCTAHHAGFHLLTFKPKHGRHVTWEKSKYTKTLSQTQSIGTKIGVVTHNLWHVKIAKKDIARDSGIWFIQLHRVWLWIKIIIFCIQWSSVVIDRVLSKCPSD